MLLWLDLFRTKEKYLTSIFSWGFLFRVLDSHLYTSPPRRTRPCTWQIYGHNTAHEWLPPQSKMILLWATTHYRLQRHSGKHWVLEYEKKTTTSSLMKGREVYSYSKTLLLRPISASSPGFSRRHDLLLCTFHTLSLIVDNICHGIPVFEIISVLIHGHCPSWVSGPRALMIHPYNRPESGGLGSPSQTMPSLCQWRHPLKAAQHEHDTTLYPLQQTLPGYYTRMTI